MTPWAKALALACRWAVVGSLVPAVAWALLPGYAMDLHLRLACAGIEALLCVAAGLCMGWGGGAGQKARAIRHTAALLLAVYLVHLACLLFFDGNFGRQADVSWQAIWQRANLRPLHTIQSYCRALQNGRMDTGIAAINLAGNLLALAPLGVLLPLVSRRWGRLGPCLALGAASIAAVEVAQLLTGTGHCDIDDFILNFAGFVAARLLAQWAAAKHPLARAAFGGPGGRRTAGRGE